jgi:hypothetical protein
MYIAPLLSHLLSNIAHNRPLKADERICKSLARRRRPHHRIRRRGGRTSPQPEFKKWRRRPAGGASVSV